MIWMAAEQIMFTVLEMFSLCIDWLHYWIDNLDGETLSWKQRPSQLWLVMSQIHAGKLLLGTDFDYRLQYEQMLYNLYVPICVRAYFYCLFVDFWLHQLQTLLQVLVGQKEHLSLTRLLHITAVSSSCCSAAGSACMWAVVQGCLCLSYSCNTFEIYNICDTFWHSCAIRRLCLLFIIISRCSCSDCCSLGCNCCRLHLCLECS